jgi:MtrB/PioB family decaheme-associated outer membrane protein
MRKLALGLSVLLAAGALPLTAFAAETGFDVDDQTTPKKESSAAASSSQVSVGVRFQGSSSALYGRYNGSPENGFYPYVDFDFGQRHPWDSGNTSYFDVTGTNLTSNSDRVLPNASVALKFGKHGGWGAGVFYDNISYTQSLTFHTAYTETGSLLIGTPGGIDLTGISLANPPTATDAAISANVANILTQRSIDSQRHTFGASFSTRIATHWTFSSNFAHEHKVGTKENSLLQGTGTGINSATGNILYFPEPIDYDTDRFSTSAGYNTRKMQFQLSYSLSHFVNNRLDIVALDPFSSTTIRSVPLSATYSLPPSSFAHQLKAQFGYNFSPTTRLTATLAYGLQLQDASFVPESTNPSIAVPPGPGSSFDGKVETYFASATLIMRPARAVDLKFSYLIDERNNESPRFIYGSLLNDTSAIEEPINVPYSFQSQKANAELGYHVLPSTKLTAGYTYAQKTRTFSAADLNRESTYYGRVNVQLLNTVTANLGGSHGVRTASKYDGNAPWAAIGDPMPNSYEANGLVRYSEGARRRDELRGALAWTPGGNLSLAVSGKFFRDRYPRSLYGITRDQGLSVDPDISYSPAKGLDTHLFYSYERLFYQLLDVNNVTGGGGSQFFWRLGTPNTVHTAGASVDWQVNSAVKLGASYTFQYGTTAFNESGFGVAGTGTLPGTAPWNYNVVSLPSNTSNLNSLNLHAEYQLSDDATLQFGYIYERFHSKDYLNEQLPTSPLYANEVLGADGDPSYNVHVVTAAFRFGF